MANIVLGIRLFNKEIGKGGAGLDDVDEDAASAVAELREQLEAEAADAEDLCLQYQETVVFCHLVRPPGIAEAAVLRWGEELANRRQYLSYLTALMEVLSATPRPQRAPAPQKTDKLTPCYFFFNKQPTHPHHKHTNTTGVGR